MPEIVTDLIPVNVKGKPSDLEFSVVLSSGEAACPCYKRAAARMRNPKLWHSLAGWASAHFLLTDADAVAVNRLAVEGDYLRIDVPGPGPDAGHGYDWVRVQSIEDHTSARGEWEWIAMKVHPCLEPGKGGQDAAHFFQEDASSTFIIERTGERITARYHGRNEVPNTSTDKVMDNIRNAVVAVGAMVSFSEAQWSALIKGFLMADTGE